MKTYILELLADGGPRFGRDIRKHLESFELSHRLVRDALQELVKEKQIRVLYQLTKTPLAPPSSNEPDGYTVVT